MALVRCSECENQVSTNASVCPHCGNPLHQTPEVKSITYEYKTARVTCWGLGASNAIVEKLGPELSKGWEIVSVIKDGLRSGLLRHVYTVVLKRAEQRDSRFGNVSIFHGEKSSQPIFHDEETRQRDKRPAPVERRPEEVENSYAMQNEKQIAGAIEVETDSHGEAVCPKCRKTVTFDPPNSARRCNHCKTMLKPVKKKG